MTRKDKELLTRLLVGAGVGAVGGGLYGGMTGRNLSRSAVLGSALGALGGEMTHVLRPELHAIRKLVSPKPVEVGRVLIPLLATAGVAAAGRRWVGPWLREFYRVPHIEALQKAYLSGKLTKTQLLGHLNDIYKVGKGYKPTWFNRFLQKRLPNLILPRHILPTQPKNFAQTAKNLGFKLTKTEKLRGNAEQIVQDIAKELARARTGYRTAATSGTILGGVTLAQIITQLLGGY